MATEVGAAYVRLLPSMRGFTAAAKEGLTKSINESGKEAGEQGGDTAGTGFASKFTDKLKAMRGPVGKVLGVVAKATAGVGAAVGALTIHGGITRLMGLEKANQQMKSMGLKVETIQGLTSGLLKTLRGTPYALNDGAQALAGMVSSGAPLEKVNKYVAMIADAAAFSQQPLKEVSVLFQKIQTQGRVQGDEIMQLAERGIPAMQVLSKGLGKTVQETQKLMKKGEISADDFFAAWEKGAKGFGKTNVKLAGAAKGAGDTTAGAFANMRAAFARLGESLLGTVFPDVKTFFNKVTTHVDNLSAKVKPFADKFWVKMAEGVDKGKGALGDLAINAGDLVKKVDWAGMSTKFKEAAGKWAGGLIEGVKTGVETGDWKTVGTAIGNAIGQALENVGDLGVKFVKFVGNMAEQTDWYGIGIKIGKQAIGFVLGFVIGIANFDIGKLFEGIGKNWSETIFGIIFLALLPAKVVGIIAKALTKIPIVGPFLAWIFKGLTSVSKKLVGAVGKLIGGLGKGFFRGFARIFPGVGAKLGSWLATLFWKLDSFFKSIPRGLAAGVRNVGAWLRATGITIAETIGAWFGTMVRVGFNAVRNFGRWLIGIPGLILGNVLFLISALYGMGWDLIQGFINGIVDKAKDIPGILKDAVLAPVNAFLPKKLELGSPSKLTERFGKWVGEGFIEGLRGTRDDVKAEIEGLISELGELKTKSLREGSLAIAKAFQGKMLKTARKRDMISNLLGEAPDTSQTAWDKLTELRDEAKEFRSSIRSAFMGTADITSFEANNFRELSAFMALAKTRASQFGKTMQKLEKLGLNNTMLDQLYNAGPESLERAQMILSGGAKGIKELNTSTSGMWGAANKTALQASKDFYDAGIKAAEGVVAGLTSKKTELNKTMSDLGKQLVIALKKELGIKSPSRIFAALGRFVPAGFAQGILGGISEVRNATTRMVHTPSMFGPQDISALSQFVPQTQLPWSAGIGNKRVASDPLAIYISADGLNRKLMEWLQEAIRVEGGDVQKVLGTGKKGSR